MTAVGMNRQTGKPYKGVDYKRRYADPDRQRAMNRARQNALHELRRRHHDEYLTVYRQELVREGIGPLGLGMKHRSKSRQVGGE